MIFEFIQRKIQFLIPVLVQLKQKSHVSVVFLFVRRKMASTQFSLTQEMKAHEKFLYHKKVEATNEYRNSMKIRLGYTHKKLKEIKENQALLTERMGSMSANATYRWWYMATCNTLQQRMEKYQEEKQELIRELKLKNVNAG